MPFLRARVICNPIIAGVHIKSHFSGIGPMKSHDHSASTRHPISIASAFSSACKNSRLVNLMN